MWLLLFPINILSENLDLDIYVTMPHELKLEFKYVLYIKKTSVFYGNPN